MVTLLLRQEQGSRKTALQRWERSGWQAKLEALTSRNVCSPENLPRTEIAVRNIARRRATVNLVKADVRREETSKSTSGATGVGDEASSERLARVTSGRSTDQPWVVQAARTRQRVCKRSCREADGLAHEAVVAKKGANTLGAKGLWVRSRNHASSEVRHRAGPISCRR